MKIVIASGKGGTGKSMIASSLAILISKKRKVVACDCDVDAPNLALWLGITKFDEIKKISVSQKAFINQEICKRCGKCKEYCQFFAIEKVNEEFKVNQFLCEGCGVCKIVCPFNAIELREVESGEIRINYSAYDFPVISGFLYPGQTGSGKIVELVKKEIERFEYEIAILDAPAGLGCPVIAALKDADYAILVTEPSPTAFLDLKRILKLVNHFNLQYGVVINKFDLNEKISDEIESFVSKNLLGKIPYDKRIVDCLISLKPAIFVKEVEKKIKIMLSELFSRI